MNFSGDIKSQSQIVQNDENNNPLNLPVTIYEGNIQKHQALAIQILNILS